MKKKIFLDTHSEFWSIKIQLNWEFQNKFSNSAPEIDQWKGMKSVTLKNQNKVCQFFFINLKNKILSIFCTFLAIFTDCGYNLVQNIDTLSCENWQIRNNEPQFCQRSSEEFWRLLFLNPGSFLALSLISFFHCIFRAASLILVMGRPLPRPLSTRLWALPLPEFAR